MKIGWIFGSCPCYDRGFVDQTWRPEFRRHCPMIVDLSLVWMYRSGRSGKIDSKFRHEKSQSSKMQARKYVTMGIVN